MIVKLLELRTLLLKAYQKTRFVINPLVKFVLAWMVFKGINTSIGYDSRFTGNTVTLLLSVICAVLPVGFIVFMSMALSLVHMLKASIYVALLLLMAYIVLYAMLMRFDSKHAIVAVLIPMLAGKNLHYAIPIILGCIATPVSILPCACGVIVYYMFDIVKGAASRQVALNLDDILQLFIDVADATMANKIMFGTIAVFAMVIIVVFIIRQFSFEYAFVVSIGAGVVTNILGFLFADLKFSLTANIGVLALMSVVGGLIAYVVEFMKRVLDYTSVERVQFEDDEYYYYVKAVPKVNVSIPRHNVKRIGDDDDEDENGIDDDESEYSDISIVGGDDVRYEEYTDDDYRVNTDSSDDVRYEEYTDDDYDEVPEKASHKKYAFDADKYEPAEDPGRYDAIKPDMPDDDSEATYVDYDDDDFE
ncbi:MAG: hypothetical protein K6G81_06090 [Lachnospiraceae bacterium]|nr:hypothetical protein [Lachnospiraceae bacterium]